MKLRTKLLVTFMVASVVPLAGAAYLIKETMRDTLSSEATKSLLSARDAREESIKSYIKSIEDQIESMSGNQLVISATKQFTEAYNALNEEPVSPSAPGGEQEDMEYHRKSVSGYYKDQFYNTLAGYGPNDVSVASLIPESRASVLLQSLYISENSHPLGSKNSLLAADDGSDYSDYHEKYHAFFNDFLNKYGFYDVFLVEPENGNIVYSVYKEVDYATSLKSGPYADSGIARAFNSAIKSGTSGVTSLIDFDQYLPSYNQPASFMSRSIVENGTVIGVLIYQMPLDRINNTVANSWGLGETGKAYVVAEDGFFRTQAPFIDESTVLVMSARYDELKQRGDGQSAQLHQDYLGNSVLSVSKVVDLLGLHWLLVVELNESEALYSLYKLNSIVLIMLTLGVLFSVCVSLLVTRSTQRQLGADPKELNLIAAEIADGDLSRQFDNRSAQTGTLKVLATMQTQLCDRLAVDEDNQNRMLRLRQGMRKLTTMVCLASEDNKITFANQSMLDFVESHQSEMNTLCPGLTADSLVGTDLTLLSDNSSQLSSIVGGLKDSHEYELGVGDYVLVVKLNAIWNEVGVRTGTSMEWVDVTNARQVMDEVDTVVKLAKKGDLNARISTHNKEGVYSALAISVNGLLEQTDQVIEDVKAFMSAIAQGDLTISIDPEYEGSFAEVKRDANRSVSKLTEMVQNIRTVANTVNTASHEINTGNVDLSQRTEQAAASLQETSSSMVEMTDLVKKNAANAREAKELALITKSLAEQGGEVVGDAVKAMAGINESSDKISDIIGVIDDIAFQTNLLALNASVEAARAGEQGRGFAVVASEVRNLAGRSATAAREIKGLIEDSVHRVENGTVLVNDSGKSLDDIVAQVKKVADIVSDISASSQSQSEGITMVNQAISQLDETTQQNAALVEKATVASRSTTEQVGGLIRLIGFFSTGEAADNVHYLSTQKNQQQASPLGSRSSGTAKKTG
ncbi:hypothetical protein AB833_18330 [Chromatiales bacterium (ex Bugula neritina AB1)]|nr:hypothetical protein AB833_18330 [Chromatiales bacterium (ex Bugula neritina AB1)]